AGDDLMLGGGGDDRMAGQAGNDTMFGAGSLSGSIDMERFRITQDVSAKITFMYEEAGYQNTLGMYKIAADGTIHDVEILFANASMKGSGGDLVSGSSSLDVGLKGGEQIGFFIVPNAYAKPGMAGVLASQDGSFKFVDGKGNAGNVNGGPLKLVYVDPDGKEIDVKSEYGTDVFHSVTGANGTLNSDRLGHVKGTVDVADGSVTIGFEDLKDGGDSDFDDTVFKLEIGTVNAALLPHESTGAGTGSDQDVMLGGAGDDVMFGMADDDVLGGGAGDDQLWGNSGNDKLYGGSGADELHGGSGDDFLHGGEGDDVLEGNSGDDEILGGDGNDVISGNSGNDTLIGGSGDDDITGGSGDDIIHDGDGNDAISGNSGDDMFYVGEGDDHYAGGSGFDTLNFAYAGQGVTLNLSEGNAAGMGNDTFNSIEAVIGSDFNDVIVGSTKDDHLTGGKGDDVIRGGRGNDILSGGLGDDTFLYNKSDVVLRGEHVGVDVITDFGVGHDVLDLRDVLKGQSWSSIDEVVSVQQDGANSMVFAHIGGEDVQLAVLQDFTGYTASDMLKDGMLLV
ncbi:MAG: calcium-binding protein, partial [Hyphomicrobiaceae bacterium]